MGPPVGEAGDFQMAKETMAEAVLEHAYQFYDVGRRHVVAECWDVWSVLEELDRHEDETQTPFELDAGAIAHFARIIDPRRAASRRRWRRLRCWQPRERRASATRCTRPGGGTANHWGADGYLAPQADVCVGTALGVRQPAPIDPQPQWFRRRVPAGDRHVPVPPSALDIARSSEKAFGNSAVVDGYLVPQAEQIKTYGQALVSQ
jgi:hypothetical protein